jgi:hypothetical protein
MLTVTFKPLMLSVVKLNVVMLSVIMLNVVAPLGLLPLCLLVLLPCVQFNANIRLRLKTNSEKLFLL